MCSSMADRDSYTTNSQKIGSEVPGYHANPSKFVHQFLCKAIIVTIFLVILPLLPSQAPEFINQNFHSSSWELLQLVFVGIAVSYGLFSKRNDDTDKEHHSKSDNAQSYITRLLQVSSVFDDEAENTSVSDDNKVQTWNSQYYRGEPVVVVAKESPVLEKQNATSSRIDEKPLLLPVRSLKSRVPEANEVESTSDSSLKPGSISRSNSNSGSKRFANNSRKSRNGEIGGGSPPKMDENMEENVVHPSPIPWRSRSGRIEMREDEEGLPSYSMPPSVEDSDLNRLESRSLRPQPSRSPRPNSTSPAQNKPSPPPTPSSAKTQSPLPYLSSESQAKSVEDIVRRKIYKSSPPPPPPPPPSFLPKPPLKKSNSSLPNHKVYLQKELTRSSRSVPNDLSETEIEGQSRRSNNCRPSAQGDIPSLTKSVRTIRPSELVMWPVNAWEFDEEVTNGKTWEVEATVNERKGFTDKLMYQSSRNFKKQTFTEFPKQEKKEFIDKVTVETDEDSETESEDDCFEENLRTLGNEEPKNENATDEGPDVDKKADEFIAKFREQIRLQRIESIRRSTEQHARNHSR